MTRRERLEAKLDKRRDWAELAGRRSNSAFEQAHQMASIIPFGQPILVGHHREKRDRAYRGRIGGKMDKGCELARLAEHHESKASGLEVALHNSIFSDDADAIEAIEARIAEHEASRARMVLINKLFRKGDAAGLAALGLNYETMKAATEAPGAMPWDKVPYASCQLSNLGGRIQADKKRIGAIKARQAQAAKAEAAGGITIARTELSGTNYATVVFAEKPERSILNDLRGAGFQWGAGSWFGRTENLPVSVLGLEAVTEEVSVA